MTEAEALAIAMKAIVSAFVGTPAPAPAPPPPAPRTPRRKPRRPRPPAKAPEVTFADLPPMPSMDLPLSPEPGLEDVPPVTMAELEALLNGTAPEGTYVREAREEVGGGWLGPS